MLSVNIMYVPIYLGLLFYLISVGYSIIYLKYIYYHNDNGGGWATDFLLGINAISFMLSNYYILEDKYNLFYLGTAIAYTMGGIAHLLESYKRKYILWYYTAMTLGISGNIVRSNYGYQITTSNKYITINTILSVIILGMLYLSNLGMCYILKIDDSMLYKSNTLYLLEMIYFYGYKCFAIIEIVGSLIWYSNIENRYRNWCIIACGLNISNWLLLRTFPIIKYICIITVDSSVIFRLSHYKQFIIIWILHSINLLNYIYHHNKIK